MNGFLSFKFDLFYMRLFFLLSLSILLFSCDNNESKPADDVPNSSGVAEPKNIGYTVVGVFPHDTSAFTQGFELYKGKMLESTGLTGRSSLRYVDYKTGKILRSKKIPDSIFAEGITVLNDTLYQLTYQNKQILVYRPEDFTLVDKRSWSSEGWGITNDGANLYISDGSDKIYVVRPSDMKLMKVIGVRDHYGPVNNVNELEFINGFIYANRWGTDFIMKIDPASGIVVGRINLDSILQKNTKDDLSYLTKPGTVADSGAVLNGIAWDSASNKMIITGKLWPAVFEIQLAE